MVPTPLHWLCDPAEFLSLSELQFPPLDVRPVSRPLGWSEGLETMRPARCQVALPKGLIRGIQQWETTMRGTRENARLQTLKGSINPLVPFVIYPQGPETQDKDIGEGEKNIQKTNLSLPREDFPNRS